MKELKEFTVEFLENVIAGNGYGVAPSAVEILAKIALAAKQAEPVAVLYKTGDVLTREECADDKVFAICCKVESTLYTTPPLNHTERQGWTSSDAANAALVMLDRIETIDPVDDDRIEGIKSIIHQLAAAPKPEM